MKKHIFILLMLLGNTAFAQWIPTNAYFGGYGPGLASFSHKVYLQVYGGFSVLDDATGKWCGKSTTGSGRTTSLAGNDTLIARIMAIDNGSSYDYQFSYSTDGGYTWPGEPQYCSDPYFLGVIGNKIITIENNYSNLPTLYYTDDYGLTWNTGASLPSTENVVATRMGNEIFAVQSNGTHYKLYECTFDGTSFTSWGEIYTFPDVSFVRQILERNGILYLATDLGVKKSLNYGATWEWFGYLANIRKIAADSQNVYAMNDNYALWKLKADGNGAWSRIEKYNCSDIEASEGGLVYIISDYSIYRYVNGQVMPETAMDLSGTHSSTAVRYLDGMTFTSSGSSIYSTSDNGQSWQKYSPWELGDLYDCIRAGTNYLVADINGIGIVNFADTTVTATSGIGNLCTYSLVLFKNTLMAGTADGIYSSGNNGLSWSYHSLGGKIVYKFRIINDTLYAGTDQGLLFSLNGSSWGSTSCVIPNIYDIASTTTDLFVASGSGLLKRVPSLNAWIPVGISMVGTDVSTLLADNDRLYAGTRNGTVMYSDDGGDTWTDISHPAFTNITGMDFAGDRLAISDGGAGVWYYKAGGSGGIESGVMNLKLTLFPNPAAEKICVQYRQGIADPLVMEIKDLSGSVLKRSVIQKPLSGCSVVDVSDLPEGYYILTVSAGKYRGTSKFCKGSGK